MAVLDQEMIDTIKQYLRWNPRGLTISELTSKLNMNRNLVAKYLDMLLISGQVEMEVIGAAKVYFLSQRVPISAMLEFSSDYVIMVDTEKRVIQVNEPVLTLLNEKREQLIGKTTREMNHPLFNLLPTPELGQTGQTSGGKETEINCLLNGKTVHFRVKQVPTVFEDGSKGITFIIEDITDKKIFEDTLQISEARYRGIVEDQSEFITRFRNDGTLVFVNESYARYLGKTPADLLGSLHIPGIDDETFDTLKQALLSLDRDHPVTTIECRVSDRSGRICWNFWTIRALFDDEGFVHEYQGVGKDITEKREASARINNYIRMMEFLTHTSKAFMNMGENDDIYSYVAEQVYSLAPGFLVWVGFLDELNHNLSLKSVVGNPVAIESMQQLTGVRVCDMIFPINKADMAELISHQALVKTPSLFSLLHMQVPEETCRRIEDAAGGIDSYLMGLVSKGKILGDVGISLQRGLELPDRELIEAFIRQAAIAIDRKIAEDALIKSEQLYRSVIDNIRDVFYRTDRDGNLIMASPSYASVLGYDSLDECLGRNIADAFYLDPSKRNEVLEVVYRDGEVHDHEVVLKRKDGSPLFVAASSHLYYDESHAVLGVEGIFRDVSERHAANEKNRTHIAEMEFLSRNLQEFIKLPLGSDIYAKIASDLHSLVPDAMIIVNSFDNRTETLTVRSLLSEADRDICTQYLGRCPLGLSLQVDYNAIEGFRDGGLNKVALSLFDLCFGQIPDDVCKKITASVRIGDFYSVGFVHGDEIYGNATICLYKNSTIRSMHLVETYSRQASIALQKQVAEERLFESEKKRGEDALRNSENYLLNIFNSTQSGLLVIDPRTHTIFDANSTSADLIGIEVNSIIGSSCKRWLCPAENEPCPVTDLGQQIVRTEGIMNNVNGETGSIIKTVVPVQLGGREYLLESFIDITGRKEAERALRESEMRFRDFAGMLPQCVWECDMEGNLTFVNNRGYEMYRYEPEDLDKGLTIWQTVHPNDRERVKNDVIHDFEAFYQGEHEFPGFVHYTALRKDGTTFPTETYATLIVCDNQIVGMRGMGIDLTERNTAEEAFR